MDNQHQQAVIKAALGPNWLALAAPVRRHYDLTPSANQEIVLHGRMDSIHYSLVGKLYVLLGKPFGALVNLKGQNIPTVVKNYTTGDNKSMYWHRTFSPAKGKKTVFASRMVHVTGKEIIEFVRFGMGIRMELSVQDGALVFKGKRYEWHIGKVVIPIPNWMSLGKGVIIEKAVSDSEIEVNFRINHPLFGKTFSYKGKFIISDHDQADIKE